MRQNLVSCEQESTSGARRLSTGRARGTQKEEIT